MRAEGYKKTDSVSNKQQKAWLHVYSCKQINEKRKKSLKESNNMNSDEIRVAFPKFFRLPEVTFPKWSSGWVTQYQVPTSCLYPDFHTDSIIILLLTTWQMSMVLSVNALLQTSPFLEYSCAILIKAAVSSQSHERQPIHHMWALS